jgi:hypothetical protein
MIDHEMYSVAFVLIVHAYSIASSTILVKWPLCPSSEKRKSPFLPRMNDGGFQGLLGGRVGGQRVAVSSFDLPEDISGGIRGQHVSNRPPPNRTCTFQRIRLSGVTVSLFITLPMTFSSIYHA